MPIYEYLCSICGKYKQSYKPIDKWNEPEICICGNLMEKQVSQVGLHVPNEEVRKAEAKAKKDNCYIMEPGLKDDIRRNRKDMENKYNKAIRESVVNTVKDFTL